MKRIDSLHSFLSIATTAKHSFLICFLTVLYQLSIAIIMPCNKIIPILVASNNNHLLLLMYLQVGCMVLVIWVRLG